MAPYQLLSTWSVTWKAKKLSMVQNKVQWLGKNVPERIGIWAWQLLIGHQNNCLGTQYR